MHTPKAQAKPSAFEENRRIILNESRAPARTKPDPSSKALAFRFPVQMFPQTWQRIFADDRDRKDTLLYFMLPNSRNDCINDPLS
jgi:hypothetical protein